MSRSDVDTLRALLGDGVTRDPPESRRRLQALLTQAPPGSLPDGAWPLLDALFSSEARGRGVTRAADLPRLGTEGWRARVSLWRGDITTLDVDAIVNAANDGLTGCYQPFHACVDNAIHSAAGPRLREECGRIMAARGRPEATATATVTGGWCLPARHVVHTVGPVVRGGAPTAADAALLARCYTACLDAVSSLKLRSIAFCSISTGVFGYPIRSAAPLVLTTVRDWLHARGGSVEHVVLVTYSASDEVTYLDATGNPPLP